jgi:hypothetical protein
VPRQSSVAKITPPPAPFCHKLADLRGGGVVIGRRSWDHQGQLNIGLVGEVHRQPAHDAKVGIGVDDNPELADVHVVVRLALGPTRARRPRTVHRARPHRQQVQALWLAGNHPPDLRIRQPDAVLGEERDERL